MARCPRCGENKSPQYFHKNKARVNGLSTWCKSCTSFYWKHYRETQPERRRAVCKKYRDANKELISLRGKAQRKRRKRERLDNDINFKIKHYLACRMRKVLKGNPKTDTSENLVGCTVDILRTHIQQLFSDGMSWDNYGEWHIDHVRPCASFDLTNPEEQKKCFHYTNLQPLWAKDNLKKGDKLLEDPRV